ncbi:MAG TPA: formyltransferase family protein [Rhodocyclaceae bacterium]|nr:formyltransferase family protein [Rhodocyclaceae bacterium]
MRFAIATSDRYLGVFEAFLRAGWEPVKLFSTALNNRTDFNQAVIACAERLQMEVQLSPIRDRDLKDLADRGCAVLAVASYNWRIADWRPHLPYAVNFHSSLLPEGRGPYPAVRAILENRRLWGVSCHKLEQQFDAGDVLAQETFPMSDDECHERLDLKIQMAAIRLAERVANRFGELWQGAAPQGPGSYWKRWTEEERTIDFTRPVEDILRHARAFGLLESLARINDVAIYVRRVVGWREPHRHPPGTLVHSNNRSLVVAAADGYIGVIEWSLIAAHEAGGIGR